MENKLKALLNHYKEQLPKLYDDKTAYEEGLDEEEFSGHTHLCHTMLQERYDNYCLFIAQLIELTE